MNVTDTRQDALCTWFSKHLNLQNVCLTTVSADASFRRYFRYSTQDVSYILVDAPTATEKNREFIEFATNYAEQGIDVPRVLFHDIEQGFMCLTDLGNQTLLPRLIAGDLYWYPLAIQQLNLVACVEPIIPRSYYDSAFFNLELSLFEQWFCDGLLRLPSEDYKQEAIKQCFALLVNNAMEQPQVTVHRDFHSRNIMIRDEQSLSIIDFQDTVTGPLTYDLASLLKDCYFKLPLVERELLLEQAYELFSQTLAINCAFEQFKQWFDLMGLQRHLKVCGIFSRLSLRDNKHHYLDDLPLVIEYIQQTCSEYPQLKPLAVLFEQSIIPALTQRNI